MNDSLTVSKQNTWPSFMKTNNYSLEVGIAYLIAQIELPR